MKDNTNSGKSKLPVIKCECGVEILLVPDLKEMSLVVQEHAQKHKEAIKNKEEAEITYSIIEKALTAQILRLASQIG
jgi:hypothetical protein